MELVCIGQEILNWGGELLTDCITTCTKKGSVFERPTKTLTNDRFMLEANRLNELSKVYGRSSFFFPDETENR